MNSSSRANMCNCFASRQAARYLTRLYERHLAPVELTSTQFTILLLLDEEPGIPMRELSEAMVMDRTSLVRALKPIQRDGLIEIAASPKDARQNVMSLTAAGRQRLEQALPLWQQAQHEFEGEFGLEPAEETRKLLLKIGQPG
ncbi:MarR family winged helix-turn-helix transcriptional regulator [Dyella sp. GSA-30]|uniref:MarR family winged helix-turn-helix transcriptional regulator n=1 Tax=Dyella sp. GSA-30 TaxID=2994496 RepID=UPI0024931422|nr:MarR family winged helix-turn-helix transcriptional regulator [Dyella sp. GSA-30]BDU19495.1 MarR family transcriptional regulator [Dyella sp. GSA-30]